MRKLFAALLVAVILLGGDLIWRTWAQTNTFCANNLACTITGAWNFTSTNTATTPLKVSGAVSQSADEFQVTDSSGNILLGAGPTSGIIARDPINTANWMTFKSFAGSIVALMTNNGLTDGGGNPYAKQTGAVTAGHLATWSSSGVMQDSGVTLVGSAGSAPLVVYATASGSINSSIGLTTMATAGGSGNLYRFTFYLDQTALGATCTTNTTIQVLLTFTDPNNGSGQNLNLGTLTIVNNGFIGTNNSVSLDTGWTPKTGLWTPTVEAKASTAVQYSTVYTGGTCNTLPKYQIYPILEQLQ